MRANQLGIPLILYAGCAYLAACSTADPDAWLTRQQYRITAQYHLEDVPQDASGLSYDPHRKGLWLVSDDPATLYFLNLSGEVEQKITLNGFDDPEAITWTGGDSTGFSQLMISEERRARVVSIEVTGHTETLDYSSASVQLQMDKQGSNNGIEGLSYQADENRLWITTEYHPQAVFSLLGDALSESWRSPFWQSPWDYSGLTFVPETRSLLVLSDRNQRLTEYDLEGRERARLSLKEIPNPEGIALTADGAIYICSEPNQLFKLSPTTQKD